MGLGALVGGSIIGDVVGGYFAKRANDKAVNAASATARDTLAQQRAMYDEWRGLTDPYRERLASFIDAPASTSPLARLRKVEGERAINRALSSRGLGSSSFAVRSLSDFNRKNFAEDYENNLNRKIGIVGALSGVGSLPGMIQSQTGAIGQAGATQGNLDLARGQNRGAFYKGVGDALSGGEQAYATLGGYNNWFGNGQQ